MNTQASDTVVYRISPFVTAAALKDLFSAAWANHKTTDFIAQLRHSLLYVCAYSPSMQLVGFVNVAWDGGIHAFLLDTTVHPDWQRRGVGRELVRRAADAAQARGMEWLHVDYEPQLAAFYHACGFTPTLASLMRLARPD